MEFAEACSGIRSLVSLLALATVYGYVVDCRTSVRAALMLGTIPVAIIANGFRIAGTALAAQYYGSQAAEAFFDTFSGWILFTVAFTLLFLLYRLLLWITPPQRPISQDPPAQEKEKNVIQYPALDRALIITVILVVVAIYVGRLTKTEAVALREPLAGLSMQLGHWKGRDTAKFDERIIAKLGVDEYLSRFYQNSDPSQIHLYVGYYQSQREGDTIHSPRNCLPGAGWHPVKSGRVVIPLGAENAPEVNRYVIQKGLDKQIVLYWYQSHGRVLASEYWAKIYLILDSIWTNRSDGALVRVMSPIFESERAAEQQAIDFARTLFPLLDRHLPL
jgi:EpsI family protein